MKVKTLFLALLFVASQVLASEALTSNSMDEVLFKVEEQATKYGRSQVLLVFDIDNTLLTATNDLGSDQWYSWQEKMMKDPNCRPTCVSTNVDDLIRAQGLLFTLGKMKATETELAEKIKKLQAKGQKVILLTSRGHNFRSLTEASLAANDMQFANSTLHTSKDLNVSYLPYDITRPEQAGLNQADIETAGLKAARPVSFQNGIYMTSGQNKGVMLKVLLNRYQKNYKAIVFADDQQRHVDRMQAIMGTLSDVTTYRYSKIDPEVERFDRMDKIKVIQDWAKLEKTVQEIGF